MQLVSGHAIPDALHCLRYRRPDRGTHLFEFWPHCLGLSGNILVDGRGNALFHTVILCSVVRMLFLRSIPQSADRSSVPCSIISAIVGSRRSDVLNILLPVSCTASGLFPRPAPCGA